MDDDVIQVTAIKRSEDSDDLIIRLFEPTGKGRSTTLFLAVYEKKLKVHMSGFEIKTLRVSYKKGWISEADLVEKI